MKRIIFAVIACCLLLCTGCKKDDFVTNKYKAYFEFHMASAENQHSVETLLKNWNSVWMSEIELTLLNTSTTDAEAHTKFETSVAALVAKKNDWDPFFQENDYMIYILKRTTPGNEEILRQVRFDKDGHINL